LFDVVAGGTVKFLFEDRFLIDGLKLGLEVLGLSAAVGSTSLVDEIVARVFLIVNVSAPRNFRQPYVCAVEELNRSNLPVAFACALLLDALWISVNVA